MPDTQDTIMVEHAEADILKAAMDEVDNKPERKIEFGPHEEQARMHRTHIRSIYNEHVEIKNATRRAHSLLESKRERLRRAYEQADQEIRREQQILISQQDKDLLRLDKAAEAHKGAIDILEGRLSALPPITART